MCTEELAFDCHENTTFTDYMTARDKEREKERAR